MSDLISRKAVTTEIHNYFKGLIDKGIHNVDVVDCSAEISKRIDGIQAAFDVDKVVEQLEDYGKYKGLLRITDNPENCDNYVPVREVKKIVKGAVKE